MRSTKRKFFESLLVGTSLTISFFIVGALFSGGGHSLTAMVLFFPYGVALGFWLEGSSWKLIADILIVVQFPIYIFLLTRFKGGRRKVLLLILIVIHMSGTLIGLEFERNRKGRRYYKTEVMSALHK